MLSSWKSWNMQGLQRVRLGLAGERPEHLPRALCRRGEPCGPLGSRSTGRLAEDSSWTGGSAGQAMPHCHWTSVCQSGKCVCVDWNELTYVLEARGPCFLVYKVRTSGSSAPAAPTLEPHERSRSFTGQSAVSAGRGGATHLGARGRRDCTSFSILGQGLGEAGADVGNTHAEHHRCGLRSFRAEGAGGRGVPGLRPPTCWAEDRQEVGGLRCPPTTAAFAPLRPPAAAPAHCPASCASAPDSPT